MSEDKESLSAALAKDFDFLDEEDMSKQVHKAFQAQMHKEPKTSPPKVQEEPKVQPS